jgi:hypothetical protein
LLCWNKQKASFVGADIGGRFNAIGHTPNNKVGLKKVLCGRGLNYNPVS